MHCNGSYNLPLQRCIQRQGDRAPSIFKQTLWLLVPASICPTPLPDKAPVTVFVLQLKGGKEAHHGMHHRHSHWASGQSRQLGLVAPTSGRVSMCPIDCAGDTGCQTASPWPPEHQTKDDGTKTKLCPCYTNAIFCVLHWLLHWLKFKLILGCCGPLHGAFNEMLC